MRAAKIDQDRLIIQQHVESSKHALEMATLKKKNEELEAMMQQKQPDSEMLSALQREQEKVTIQQGEIEKLQGLLKADGGDRDELVKAKATAEQELVLLRNELLALRNKVVDLSRVEQTSADMTATLDANAQRIVVLEKHIAEDAKDRTELQVHSLGRVVVLHGSPSHRIGLTASTLSHILCSCIPSYSLLSILFKLLLQTPPRHQLQTVLTNKDNRIKQLEKQIAETDASSVTALTVKDQRIAELEKQLAEASKVKSVSAEQLAALTSKSNRIEELEKQLTLNDHNHRMDLIKVTFRT